MGQLFLAKCVFRFPTATLTAVHKQDTGLADSTGFVHDWLSSLHISHHAVISSAAASLPIFFFVLHTPVNCVSPFVTFFSCSVQLTKAHRQGHMVKVDWLDRLTFREIEMINEVSRLAVIYHHVFKKNEVSSKSYVTSCGLFYFPTE